MQAQARTTPPISELAPGDRRVLNENEVANRWGVSPKTLQRWRSEGRGPKYLKLSKRVDPEQLQGTLRIVGHLISLPCAGRGSGDSMPATPHPVPSSMP